MGESETLFNRVYSMIYGSLNDDSKSFCSYLTSDIIDLVKVKCGVNGYVGKWVGTEHEEKAYGGVSDDQQSNR